MSSRRGKIVITVRDKRPSGHKEDAVSILWEANDFWKVLELNQPRQQIIKKVDETLKYRRNWTPNVKFWSQNT